jgi:DHA1 family inner membrane transport protein
MAYFSNRAVNLLNLHYALHSIALYGSGAFFFVYLLKAGVPLPGVLVSIAAILAGRFLIRPASCRSRFASGSGPF